MVQGALTGLPIPAASEIVLEGWAAPGDERIEGPFGEFHGYYPGKAATAPAVKIERVYFRNDPIIVGHIGAAVTLMRQLLAERDGLAADARRWRSSTARLAAAAVPHEALAFATEGARTALAALADRAAADRQSLDLDTLQRDVGRLVVCVDLLLELLPALALGYENLRARLAAGDAA